MLLKKGFIIILPFSRWTVGNDVEKFGNKRIMRIHSVFVGDERIPVYPNTSLQGATRAAATNYLMDKKEYGEEDLIKDDLLAYMILVGRTQFMAISRLPVKAQRILHKNPFWNTYGLALGKGSPLRKFIVTDALPIALNFEGTRLARNIERYNYVSERMKDMIDLEKPILYGNKWIEIVTSTRHATIPEAEGNEIMEQYKELKDKGLVSEDAKDPLRGMKIDVEYCVNLAPLLAVVKKESYTHEEVGAMVSGIVNMKRMGKNNLLYTIVLYAELDDDGREIDIKAVNYNFAEYLLNKEAEAFLNAYDEWLDKNDPYNMAKKVSELIKNAK